MTTSRRVAVAVILRDGRVLVQTRNAPGRWQGRWEFPGGGLEPGEDGAACVRRECLEELGLAVEPAECLDEVRWSSGDVDVEIQFLRCDVAAAGEPRPLQGQDLRWASASDLARLDFLPANAALVARLCEQLSRRAPRSGDGSR